jgi:hypothetical protein
MEKGIISNKEHEYLVGGKVEFDKNNSRFLIRKPTLLIGSDRLDYYDLLGRRREQLGL